MTKMMNMIMMIMISWLPIGWCSKWYHRYKDTIGYPEYCSTMEQMKRRWIPPFPMTDRRIGETRLVHVSAILRHGARTPASISHCWEGYYESVESGVWQCPVIKTYSSPPSPKEILSLQPEERNNEDPFDNDNIMKDYKVDFYKSYDAMMHSSYNLSNVLNGTCQLGQLIGQGYHQLYTNGKIIRDAYVYNQNNYDHDLRMRLLNVGDSSTLPWDERNIRIRSDDDQRTVMSAQVLLRAMFQKEINSHSSSSTTTNNNNNNHIRIPVHLADRTRDILDPNENICPRLEQIRTTIEASKEFIAFNESHAANTLRTFMKYDLHAGDQEINIHDCILPLLCTDRTIPEALLKDAGLVQNQNDTNTILHRLFKFASARNYMIFTENDSEYAKLAMGPLWAEILENILPTVHGEEVPVKFAIFSGHDDTIMPLMASLGPYVWEDGTWPTYAAMVLIEIHEFVDGQTDREIYKSKYAFRLIYNGEVITHRIDACPDDSELCDTNILLSIVEPMAIRDRDCAIRDDIHSLSDQTSSKKRTHSNTAADSTTHSGGGGFLSFVSTLIFGIVLGGIGTIACIRFVLPYSSLFSLGLIRHPTKYDTNDDGIMLSSTRPFSDQRSDLDDGEDDEYDGEETANLPTY